MKQYFLKFRYYSYDSDSYESIFKIEFSSHEELKNFYAGFKKLSTKNIPYFGEYVNIDEFNDFYKNKLGYYPGIDTGGVSTKHIHAFEVDTQEISLE